MSTISKSSGTFNRLMDKLDEHIQWTRKAVATLSKLNKSIDKRLTVLEHIVLGNGSPGIHKLIEKQSAKLDNLQDQSFALQNKLSEYLGSSDASKAAKKNTMSSIGVWLAGGSLIVLLLGNLIMLIGLFL